MPPSVRLRRRMSGRDIDERGRASTPLELLFDLTFVVAVAAVASQLAESILDGNAEGHSLGTALISYLMVFFAIWWAWVNFTWFSSSYDTDDVPYRLLTMLQMAGVLVLAAGVKGAFDGGDYRAVTLGYFIMRIGLIGNWIRVYVEDRDSRGTARRFAIGVSVVQVGWLARLLLPPEVSFWAFFPLALAEMLVPAWAERTGSTHWHPEHIAERYGLFTIILLGESVSAVTIAVQSAFGGEALRAGPIVVAASGLVLLFCLWWIYFLAPVAEALVENRAKVFGWAYGHYLLFVAVAAVGAALEVAVDASGERSEASPMLVGYALALPVVVFFLALVFSHRWLRLGSGAPPLAIGLAAIIVLALPLAAPSIGVTSTVGAIALTVAVVTAVAIVAHARRRRAVQQ